MSSDQPARPKEPLWTAPFLLLTLSSTLLFFGFQMLLPTLPLYVSRHGGSNTEVGLVIGLLTLSAILIRPFSGLALDVVGRRIVLIAGIVICLVAMGGYYFSFTVFMILLLRFVHGLGWGVSTTTLGVMASDIIPASRRGEGMGYYGLGTTLAMATGPLAGLWLVKSYGFGTLFAVVFASTLLSLLCSQFVSSGGKRELAGVNSQAAAAGRPASEASAAAAAGESSGGQVGSGGEQGRAVTGSADGGGRQAAAVALGGSEAAAAVRQAKPAASMLSRLVDRQALFPSFLVLLLGATYGGIVSFITLFGKEAGIENIGLFFMANALSVLVVRPVSGKLFDRRGHFWVLFPGALFCIVGLLLLSAAASTAALVTAAVFYGFGFGAIQPSIQAWIINRCAPEKRGAANATFFSAFDLGIGGGGMLLGALAERTTYSQMYAFSSLFIVVYAVVYVLYMMKGKRKATA